MMSIASIVEGDGEVAALPVLLRRLAAEWSPGAIVQALQPIRVRRDKFLNKDEEFRRQLLLAAAKSGEDGWVLIVLDADDDCPATLGSQIYQRAQQYIPHRRLSVVLANREFEACWPRLQSWPSTMGWAARPCIWPPMPATTRRCANWPMRVPTSMPWTMKPTTP